MAAVQIKGRVPEETAALFDLAVDVMAQTAQVVRRHRGGITRTVAFTQNAAVIAALTEWTEAVLAAQPELAFTLAAQRIADPETDPHRRRALEQALQAAGPVVRQGLRRGLPTPDDEPSPAVPGAQSLEQPPNADLS